MKELLTIAILSIFLINPLFASETQEAAAQTQPLKSAKIEPLKADLAPPTANVKPAQAGDADAALKKLDKGWKKLACFLCCICCDCC